MQGWSGQCQKVSGHMVMTLDISAIWYAALVTHDIRSSCNWQPHEMTSGHNGHDCGYWCHVPIGNSRIMIINLYILHYFHWLCIMKLFKKLHNINPIPAEFFLQNKDLSQCTHIWASAYLLTCHSNWVDWCTTLNWNISASK